MVTPINIVSTPWWQMVTLVNIWSVVGLVRWLITHANPRRIFACCGRAARYVFNSWPWEPLLQRGLNVILGATALALKFFYYYFWWTHCVDAVSCSFINVITFSFWQLMSTLLNVHLFLTKLCYLWLFFLDNPKGCSSRKALLRGRGDVTPPPHTFLFRVS